MSEGARSRVVVFGDVIDDIVVRPHRGPFVDVNTAASIRQLPGGAAANFSAWLGSAGVAVDFIGRVGAIDCEYHAGFLAHFGVRAHLTPDATRPTDTIIVIVDENDSRTVLTERGANRVLTPNDVPDTLLDGATSVLVPNLAEGRVLIGLVEPLAVAARLAQSFPLVALTFGAEGTIVAARGQTVLVPVVRLERADTTGVGDAFSAGFVAAWLDDATSEAAAHAGARLAARAIAIVGGRPA